MRKAETIKIPWDPFPNVPWDPFPNAPPSPPSPGATNVTKAQAQAISAALNELSEKRDSARF